MKLRFGIGGLAIGAIAVAIWAASSGQWSSNPPSAQLDEGMQASIKETSNDSAAQPTLHDVMKTLREDAEAKPLDVSSTLSPAGAETLSREQATPDDAELYIASLPQNEPVNIGPAIDPDDPEAYIAQQAMREPVNIGPALDPDDEAEYVMQMSARQDNVQP